jgi:hypothetical protein
VAGMTLLIPASLGLLLTGVPTILCPLPLLTTIPALLLSTWRLHYLATSLPVLLFFVNAGWAVALVFAFVRTWQNGASFRTSLFVHWMLFAWLAWYAFPYLGELP